MIVQLPVQLFVPFSRVDVEPSIEIDCARAGLVNNPVATVKKLPICQTVARGDVCDCGFD